MADEVDLTDEAMRVHTDARIAQVRKEASQMPVGEPGDCGGCGEYSQRLVNKRCARCRDARERMFVRRV
jgi:hypothetical protein